MCFVIQGQRQRLPAHSLYGAHISCWSRYNAVPHRHSTSLRSAITYPGRETLDRNLFSSLPETTELPIHRHGKLQILNRHSVLHRRILPLLQTSASAVSSLAIDPLRLSSAGCVAGSKLGVASNSKSGLHRGRTASCSSLHPRPPRAYLSKLQGFPGLVLAGLGGESVQVA